MSKAVSKAVRFSASIPASKVTAKESDHQEFVSIALFSGIGLLISLVAILLGAQGVWY